VTDPTINESHPLYWQRKFDAKVQEVKELQVEIAHWRATVSESDAHRDLWRRRAEACGWPTEADMDAAREPT